MINKRTLAAIHRGKATRSEVARTLGVHWSTVDRHYRKVYSPKPTWTKKNGIRCRYDVGKAERAYYLRISGDSWYTIAKKIYSDRTRADNASRLVKYFERDFVDN